MLYIPAGTMKKRIIQLGWFTHLWLINIKWIWFKSRMMTLFIQTYIIFHFQILQVLTHIQIARCSYTLNPARFPRIEGASGNVSEHHTSRSSWHNLKKAVSLLFQKCTIHNKKHEISPRLLLVMPTTTTKRSTYTLPNVVHKSVIDCINTMHFYTTGHKSSN